MFTAEEVRWELLGVRERERNGIKSGGREREIERFTDFILLLRGYGIFIRIYSFGHTTTNFIQLPALLHRPIARASHSLFYFSLFGSIYYNFPLIFRFHLMMRNKYMSISL